MSTTVNLEDIVRGDDIAYTINIIEDSSPADVTDDVISMTFKKNSADPDVLAAMQNSITPVDGTSGEVIISFTGAETTIQPGIYNYDVEWKRTTSAAGEVVTLLLGKVEVLQDVTHGT